VSKNTRTKEHYGSAAGEIGDLLVGLLPERLASGYAVFLSHGECSEPEAIERVGSPSLLEELKSRGLVHRVVHSSSTAIRPTDPALAFREIIHDLQKQLIDSSDQLAQAYGRLNDIQRIFSQQSLEQTPEEGIEIVTDRDKIHSLSLSLINSAQSDFLGLHTWRFNIPLRKESSAPPPRSVTSRNVRCRSVYSTEYFDNEIGYYIIQNSITEGEEVRIMRNLPMKMKLVDEEVAMLPLTPSGASGIALIKAPIIVKALRQYFELLWARATPVSSPSGNDLAPAPSVQNGPSELQIQLVGMMALGLKDESIANRTGLSLRTVRRHISMIMEMLSAETRFAAGVMASKRGWIK
jgi:DNA-binding CsgD family transcriptional regulator